MRDEIQGTRFRTQVFSLDFIPNLIIVKRTVFFSVSYLNMLKARTKSLIINYTSTFELHYSKDFKPSGFRSPFSSNSIFFPVTKLSGSANANFIPVFAEDNFRGSSFPSKIAETNSSGSVTKAPWYRSIQQLFPIVIKWIGNTDSAQACASMLFNPLSEESIEVLYRN
jgi:hypothetical protein